MPTVSLTGLTAQTDRAIADVLAGRRRGLGALLPFAGPAFVASVAYVDPGNFATNIQAGAHYGYGLLWVVLLANAAAMLFQALSARLGIVTGRNLAELSRDHFPRPVVMGMWGVSEVAAMATDLAEFLGGAIGLSLLFHLPLFAGMVITGAATYGILLLDRRGYRPLELAITAMVAVISVSYVVELFFAPPDWAAAAHDLVHPVFADGGALTLAVGIVGATVMPHAIYLHSGLTQARGRSADPAALRSLLRYSNIEVAIALSLAGLVNMAMVIMAASAFHAGHSDVAEIETAFHTLVPLFGGAAAGVFLLALIASGLSSSAVGTMAGQVIMQGFVGWRIPVWLRRAVTMLPAFAAVGFGLNATDALVWSQVILSLALPVPLVALLVFIGRRDIMGSLVSGRATVVVAGLATTIVLLLNLLLLLQLAGVNVPFLPAG
jgi:manganese transport protein